MLRHAALILLCLVMFLLPKLGRADNAPQNTALFAEAMAEAKLEKWRIAEEKFREVLRRQPDHTAARFNLGNTLYIQKRYADAAKEFERIVQQRGAFAPAAALMATKAYIAINQHRRAWATLESVRGMKSSPTLKLELAREHKQIQAHVLMQEGSEAYQAGNYEKALSLLLRADRAKPEYSSKIALGLVSRKLGRSDTAAKYFRDAEKLSQDPAEKDLVKKLMLAETGTIDPRRKKILPTLSLSLGYDSNYFADADNLQEEPQEQMIFRAGAQAIHELMETTRWTFAARYLAAIEGPISSAEDRTAQLGVEGQALFSNNNWLVGGFPRINQYFQSTNLYYLKPELGLRLRRYWSRWEAALNYTLAYNSPQNADFDFLRGSTHERNIGIAWTNHRHAIGASMHFDSYNTGNLTSASQLIPLRHTSIGPTFEASFYPNLKWEITGSIFQRRKKFSTPALPGNLKRDDSLWSYLAQTSRQFSRDWKILLSAEFTKNTSTLGPTSVDDKNFRQFIFYSSIIWEPRE